MSELINEVERRLLADPANPSLQQQFLNLARRQQWLWSGETLDNWLDQLKEEPQTPDEFWRRVFQNDPRRTPLSQAFNPGPAATRAVQALVTAGPRAVALCSERLRKPLSPATPVCLEVLAQIGPPLTSSALQSIVPWLASPSPQIILAAAAACYQLGPLACEQLLRVAMNSRYAPPEFFLALLQDQGPCVAEIITKLFQDFAGRQERLIRAMIGTFKTMEVWQRLGQQTALLGTPWLREVFGDEKRDEKRPELLALARAGLENADPEIERISLRILAQQAPRGDEDLILQLWERLESSPDIAVRANAIEALGYLGTAELCAELLRARIKDPAEPELIRAEAVSALGRMAVSDEESLSILVGQLNSSSRELQRRAFLALQSLGLAALPTLKALAPPFRLRGDNRMNVILSRVRRRS